MSISVKRVNKLYKKQLALNNVSFNIKKGETVGFLGPNGAGKSTMMKIISCYIPQSSGEIKVCGLNTIDSDYSIKKRIGYLPENNPLYPNMYIKEYLTFLANIHHLEDYIIDDIMRRVGVNTEKNKKIGALSKGYKQRVGLAQALIHNPEVLILDEPTTGLDPNQVIEMRNLIKEIGHEKTILFSTHIMQEVEHICDRVIIIDKGIIIADDTIEKLTTKEENLEKVFHKLTTSS